MWVGRLGTRLYQTLSPSWGWGLVTRLTRPSPARGLRRRGSARLVSINARTPQRAWLSAHPSLHFCISLPFLFPVLSILLFSLFLLCSSTFGFPCSLRTLVLSHPTLFSHSRCSLFSPSSCSLSSYSLPPLSLFPVLSLLLFSLILLSSPTLAVPYSLSSHSLPLLSLFPVLSVLLFSLILLFSPTLTVPCSLHFSCSL